MCSKNITDKQKLEWSQRKILVVDEVSFMTEKELMKLLDNKLMQYGHRNKVFGGYSIIFGGDFRQLAKGKKNVDETKSFAPSEELIQFIRRAKECERRLMDLREKNMQR